MRESIPQIMIERKIFLLRHQKVILSPHLAELYGVETRTLNQAVKRNMTRFPEDFMFQLTDTEVAWLVSQNVIPHRKYFGGTLPYAFTEQGVAMLSSVLRSERAIQMNIAIMRAFVKFVGCGFYPTFFYGADVLPLRFITTEIDDKRLTAPNRKLFTENQALGKLIIIDHFG